MTKAIVDLASRYGRYGYRRITALLRCDGWRVNHKRVERIWRREGLKVPQKQPKRGRLWFNDGSCIRLRPRRRNHVWAYDFVMLRTHEGRAVRLLTVIDEYTRECFAIKAARQLRSDDVLECLAELLSSTVFLIISVQITARSSPPQRCGSGWDASGSRPSTSNPGVRGRTATMRASTASSEMNCWIGKSFTRCGKLRYSPKTGDTPTTPSGLTALWATGHRFQRPQPHG